MIGTGGAAAAPTCGGAQSTTTDGDEQSVVGIYTSEFALTSMFMLRWRQWKLIEYVGFRPSLFDVEADGAEVHDLAASCPVLLRLQACFACLDIPMVLQVHLPAHKHRQ